MVSAGMSKTATVANEQEMRPAVIIQRTTNRLYHVILTRWWRAAKERHNPNFGCVLGEEDREFSCFYPDN